MNVQINKSILAMVLSLGISSGTFTQAGTYSGGAGTQDQPYQISTVNDWMELIDTSSGWDKHFILTATIDFEGEIITPVAWDTNPSSGGFQGTPFTGIFDGGGHVLKNFVIDQPTSDYVGLFGQVGSGGRIRNLGVEPLQVTGRYYVGGLCGENYDGTISTSFWDIQTSGMTTSAGGTGKTTAEMKTQSTFTLAGWDFIDTWGIEDNQTYPFLKLTYPVGDIDLNKRVDLVDLAHFAEHWLEETGI